MTGLLTGRNCGSIQFGEGLRELAEAIGKRVSFHDLGPHSEQDALGAGQIVLLRHREQCFLERQARLGQ